MKKLWSISTTVRNPERLPGILGVLKQLEGTSFDNAQQIRFQVLLIQARLYRPENLLPEHQYYFDDPQRPMAVSVARAIFDRANYVDPSMRGRQSVNPLNKLGFCIAKKSAGLIRITELGNRLLQENADLSALFFRSLLKLQFPNPASSEFSSNQGFNVSPFVATLHFINRVNQSADEKGLSKDEFSLFVPSLINAEHIDQQVENLLNYRRSSNKEQYRQAFAKGFYQVTSLTEKQKKNFDEYGDNIMRYFRLTKYFLVRSDELRADWSIDLEPTHRKEIDLLLESFDGRAKQFSSTPEYVGYLSDYSEPHLPWENIQKLREICVAVRTEVLAVVARRGLAATITTRPELTRPLEALDKATLEETIARLRDLNRELRVGEKNDDLRRDTARLRHLIALLRDPRAFRNLEPFKFEELLTDIFQAIDDEEVIKPNYLMDDAGNAISHAPGNRPDIELYYASYKATCEVTLDSGRSQWVREGQPVMRHLRAFEQRNAESETYCIFVAPRVHNDTFSTFWTAVRHEYDGTAQKIVPLTTNQIADIAETCSLLIERNRFRHSLLRVLLSGVTDSVAGCNGFSEWIDRIPQIISAWQQRCQSL